MDTPSQRVAMLRQREQGACYAYLKYDPAQCFALRRSEYARLKADWMAGKAFFTGVAFYGSEATLKLGDICAVIDTPAECMAAARADSAQDEREDALEG